LEIWAARYKQHRSLLHGGRIRRLQTDDPVIYAHVVIGEDRKHFLLLVFFTDTTLNSVQGPLRITGLDRNKSYAISLWDKPEVPSPTMLGFDSELMWRSTVTVSGEFLEKAGIVLPAGYPDSALVLEGTAEE